MSKLKVDERKKDKHGQEIQSNFQVFPGQVMFKKERGEKEETERKISEEIFPEGKGKINLEEFGFQFG